MSSGTALAVETAGLVKTFGQTRAVDGIDLSVTAGTVYGMLGPNGAGKTTTIRILTTLLRPDAGSALVFGHDVVTEAPAVRRLIGLTGQVASLDEILSATENLVIFARLLGLDRAAARRRAAGLLEEFGLADAAKRPVAKFSGGMRRRLDLAASLIVTPPVIFLDEPTTGLDPRTRAQMWQTIRRLAGEGSTVLLTTQYLDEADQLADRIAVIDRGTVVAEGTPHELKALAGRSTLQLRLADPGESDHAREAITAVLGAEVIRAPESGRITAPINEPDRVADLLVVLRDHGIRLAELSVRQPTLDQVFLAITGHQTQPKHGPREAA